MLIDTIRQYAPAFIFTTAMPPQVLAPTIASIRVLKGIEGVRLREMHWEAVGKLRTELDKHGIGYKSPEDASHVTVVELKSAELSDQAMLEMDKKGFYVQCE